MFEHVDVAHHHEEGQQGEDDKELHGLGASVAVVAIFLFTKHKGFVGIAEGLGNHGHNHGYFHAGP